MFPRTVPAVSSVAPAVATARGNVTGILAMLAAMAFFLTNDTCAKLASAELPQGQVIAMRGLMATGLIAAWAGFTGAFRHVPLLIHPLLAWRTLGEVGGTIFYLAALFHMPIANATAILQALPLLMTVLGGLLLKEPVGWRRWLAAIVGFAGVILIIRPGPAGFDAWSIAALISVGFVALRDLATRRMPPALPGLLISLVASGAVTLTGFAMGLLEDWQPITAPSFAALAGAAVFIVAGYLMIILAMRSGELAVVSPFRYSIILWAIIAGVLVWGDLPDPVAMLGIAIVAGSGIYTFHRERRRGLQERARARDAQP